ncbi:NAD(P)-dependent oxidoreductase [Propionibacteriaceae bacterium G1746]|uniref:NAD(P)-dependent oxidoreductase n=1 Tax=Aestuariimicrobium sp. G57 TaxID=3418485 RepID=UPI003C1426FA
MNRPVAWVPFETEQQARATLGDLPLEFVPFITNTEPPESLDRVEFLVLPYAQRQDVILQRAGELASLKVVQGQMAGTDAIDRFIPEGVTLCNAAGVHDAATAELALSLALARGRRLDEYARDQVAGVWQPRWGTGLADARVTILGYGRIGRAIERRVRGFEPRSVTRVATRARIDQLDGRDVEVRAIADLLDVLAQTDVLFIISPLTDQTRGLIGAEALAALPDGALVVNAGRGPIVDTAALVEACAGGRISAALDVIDPEPVPADHPLRTTANVLFSPHVGGYSSAFFPRRNALLRRQLEHFAAGEPLDNVVRIGPLV